jgi:hypothetical protein
MRIIFVPQYPTPNRYQEWWYWKLPEEFRKAGFEVLVLGEDYCNDRLMYRGHYSMFSPINMAIELETVQINEYMNLELKNDDILFLADLSFPGFFCNVLYHKKPKKCFAFCHATSLNRYDYFEDVTYSKFPVETAHSDLFDKVFVGSQYHADKLYWRNTVVTYLPGPDHLKTYKHNVKDIDIVSASRPGKQKVDSRLEKQVSVFFSEIVRRDTETADEYYQFLGSAKVLLITAFEDTFGYQIVDAINNGCIPIARNSFAYPELLPKTHLYDSDEELFDLLNNALWGMLPVPRIKCREGMLNFYNKIIKEMTYAI